MSGLLRLCLLLVLMEILCLSGVVRGCNGLGCITEPIKKAVVEPVVDGTTKVVDEAAKVGTKVVDEAAKVGAKIADEATKAAEAYENLKKNFKVAGDCVKDPTSCVVEIQKKAVDSAMDVYGDIINVAGEITNIEELKTLGECVDKFGDQKCNSDSVRDKFAEGGWKTYYGKRIWDSTVAGAVALAIFPGAQGVAVEKFYSMFESQRQSVMEVLEKIASDIGGQAVNIAYDIIQTLMDGGNFDDIFGDVGVKAALLRVTCKNDWCTGTTNGDSFFQLGFAWRYKREGVPQMPSIDSMIPNLDEALSVTPEKKKEGENQQVGIGTTIGTMPTIGTVPNVISNPNFVDSSFECSCRDACQTYPKTQYSPGTPDVCSTGSSKKSCVVSNACVRGRLVNGKKYLCC